MSAQSRKPPSLRQKLWQDLLALLEMALEATVGLLWPLVEFLLRGIGKIIRLPRKLFKRPAK